MDSKNQSQSPKHGAITLLFAGLLLFFCCTSMLPTLGASEVPVYPSQNLESMVNNYPAGTTFLIKAGVHRMQYAVPKNYDSFIGESGAVLDGAEHLTSFSQSGSHWESHVQVSWKPADPSVCDSAHPACDLPEDLFFDNVPRTRVLSLSQVGPGKWYLDYSTGNVYMGDDPYGHNVEISVRRYAFSGSATGVTISQLTIEKYASPKDAGAVHGEAGTGPLSQRWTVKWNDIRLNHGMGLRIGDYMWVYHNHIYDNGQLGMGGTGKNVSVQNNEIYYNNYAGYQYNTAGGSKFCRCYNLKIQYNNVHNNHGPGLWTDIDNDYVLLEHNTTAHNVVAGIFIEISYNETVRYNYIANDGSDPRGSSIWWGAGILVNSSPNVQIYGNTVKDCMNGIGAIQTARSSGAYGPYLVKNLSVHGNAITQATGTAEGIVKASNYDNSVYTSWNNHFKDETYSLAYGGHKYFYWLGEYWTLTQWDTYAFEH